jgi:rubredoxin
MTHGSQLKGALIVTRYRCPGCQHLYDPPQLDAFAPTPNGRALEAESRCPRCGRAVAIYSVNPSASQRASWPRPGR